MTIATNFAREPKGAGREGDGSVSTDDLTLRAVRSDFQWPFRRWAMLAMMPVAALMAAPVAAAQAPVAVGAIDDVAMFVDEPELAINFYGVFSNRPTDCTAESSDESVLRIEHEGYDITLIPVSPGTATVTVVAWNEAGADETEFTIRVSDREPLAVGELSAITLDVGDTESVDFSAAFTGTNLVFSVTSADDSVASATADGMMAVVQGLAAGNAEVTITASNSAGNATLGFQSTVQDIPPMVAQPLDDVALVVGDTASVDLSGTFSGTALRLSMEVSAPDNAATATRDGDAGNTIDIAAVSHGEAMVTVTASNSAGSVSEAFAIVVRDQMPMAVGELAAVTLTVGDSAEVDLSDAFTGNALVYSVASSAEAKATAALSGQRVALTALVAGSTTVTVTASNASGSATQEFIVTVQDIPPTVARSLDDIALVVGDVASVDFTETFAGTELRFSMASDGSEAAKATRDGEASTEIDIEALAHGETMVTVTASNTAGSVSETFTIMVRDQMPMAVGELAAVTLTVGDSAEVDFSDAFTGNALVYSVASSAEAYATATLSGQRVALAALVAGSTNVTVTASNASGSATQEFTVTVQDQVPAAVGSLPNLALTTGGDSETVETSGAFSGTALSYSVTSEGDAIAVTRSGSEVTVSPLVEGRATVTVTASNTAGSATQTFGVRVSTEAAEGSATDRSLAAIGASTLASVQSAIGARFRAARGNGQPAASQSTWQEQRFGLFGNANSMHHANSMRHIPAFHRSDSAGSFFAADWHSVHSPSGIGMHQATASDVKWEPPAEWTFWGHADRQSFEASAYDGGVSSVFFGADADFGERWMAGFAVSSSSGEADYEFAGRGASGTGSLDTELTSVFPYLHVTPGEDVEVWAIVGAGWGDVTQSRSTTAQRGSADLSMWMASLGGRRSIASADAWDVSILGDTSILELQTDGGIGIINGLEVGVARQRAGMEAARLVALQDGGSLAWFGEVAARHDSGDGETGAGGELIGGVRFDSGRLSLEAKARLLAMHAADDYEENGLSLTATVRPAPDGTGMSLSVSAHSGTGMGTTGTSAILDSHQPDLRSLQGRSDWGMAARIGHSLTAMRQPGSMTPFAELDVSSQRSRTMLGVRYDLRIPNASDRLNLEFATGHGEDHYRGSGSVTELRAAVRF